MQEYRLIELTEFTFGTGVFPTTDLRSVDVAISGDQIAFGFTDGDSPDGTAAIQIFDLENPTTGRASIIAPTIELYGEISIAAAPDGGFLALYDSYTRDTGYQQFLQFLTGTGAADGAPIGAPLVHHTNLDITRLEGGGYVAVWNEATDSEFYQYRQNIHAQFFDAGGAAVSAALRVNTELERTESNEKARVLPNGNVLITWMEATYNPDGSNAANEKLFGRIYNPNGEVLTDPVLLGTDPDQRRVANYDIAISPVGHVIVSLGSLVTDPQVQVFDALLNPLGDQQVIHVVPGESYLDSAIAQVVSIDEGIYVASWKSSHLNPVQTRVFAEDGTPLSEIFTRDGVDGRSAFSGTPVRLPNGNILFYEYDRVADIGLAEILTLNALPMGTVQIIGEAVEDGTLRADVSGVSDIDGIDTATATVQWLRDGVVISGAMGETYVVTQDDVGAAITFVYTFTDNLGFEETITSAATDAVENVNDEPIGAVVISGTARQGETLIADASGVEDADGTIEGSQSFQWLRDDVTIPGATSASYLLTADDVGSTISVRFAYDDAQGTAESLVSTVEGSIVAGDLSLTGTPNPDVLFGDIGDDMILGLGDNDRLVGNAGNDSLDGGQGADTLNGGDGEDTIIGGPSEDDLRDIIYAGEGNDSVDAGAGNDLVYGQGGNDTIAGGFGVDELQGQDGDDVITGSAFSDLVFGGAGDDFVNGGFGSDRINGGTGADRFFHVGFEGHGSDWVQDYSAAEGDVLLFGNASATRDMFQVNFAHTENAEGERSGDDAVKEAFVIYRSTGQIMWALVDGEGQSSINLKIGEDVFDLLG